MQRIIHLIVATLHALASHLHHQPKPIPAVWQAVADCESGDNWVDTDGMFDGGLQFLPSTWISFHGDQFAPTADQATRRQQVKVAQRVLRRQGPTAWPHCSIVAGLTTANGMG